MKKTTMIAAAAAAGLAGSAMASTLQDTATVDGLGGAVTMKAFDFSGTVFGGATPPNFTTSSLASMHTLISDDVETDNKVTFVLGLVNADGDGSNDPDSLGFFALVDKEFGSFSAVNNSIEMFSTASASNVQWINDAGDGLTTTSGQSGATSSGTFGWDDDGKGDGFAWTNLSGGDFMSFNWFETQFDGSGLFDTNIDGFQFVSWTGSEFEVVATGDFSSAGQFAFSVTVIPLPPAAFAGLAGLGLAAVARRRFRK